MYSFYGRQGGTMRIKRSSTPRRRLCLHRRQSAPHLSRARPKKGKRTSRKTRGLPWFVEVDRENLQKSARSIVAFFSFGWTSPKRPGAFFRTKPSSFLDEPRGVDGKRRKKIVLVQKWEPSNFYPWYISNIILVHDFQGRRRLSDRPWEIFGFAKNEKFRFSLGLLGRRPKDSILFFLHRNSNRLTNSLVDESSYALVFFFYFLLFRCIVLFTRATRMVTTTIL